MSKLALEVLDAFAELSPADRSEVAAGLKSRPEPFLVALGGALDAHPVIAEDRVHCAMREAHYDGAAWHLADSLPDSEPWATVRRALRAYPGPSDHTLAIASD